MPSAWDGYTPPMPSDEAPLEPAVPARADAAPATGRGGRAAVASTAVARRSVGSPPWAVAALVAANAVPLVGVLFWGWSTFDLMLLYWFENGVIGLVTVLKILLTEGPEKGVPRGVPGVLSRLFVAGFFSVHYGAFWSAHGFFVVLLFGSGAFFGGPSDGGLDGVLSGSFGLFGGGLPIAGRYLDGALLLSAMGLVVSHGLSFVGNVLQRGEDLRTAPTQLMSRPYARVFVLHITLVLGAFLVLGLGEPIAALALFVVLKTVVDLGAHLRAHRTRPTAYDAAR